jgi:hypothetical protein
MKNNTEDDRYKVSVSDNYSISVKPMADQKTYIAPQSTYDDKYGYSHE